MADEYDNETGEVIERPSLPAAIDTSGLNAIVRAEIDAQIVTAKQFPRSIQKVVGNITTLATLDDETASECLYALVRKKKQKNRNDQANDEENKPIEGPSIRLAEIAAQCFGNCRIEARVVAVNRQEKYVEAEGIFLDLETNMASKATVRRRISTKSGYLFSEDMINVTSNAACAIAKRNAILAGIPRGLYRPAYMAARKIVAGTAETLAANREKAIKAFATFGVTPEQLFDVLDVEGEREIKTDHIVTLRSMFATLKSGEATVEEMFGKHEPDHAVVKNPLDDKPQEEAGDGAKTASKADPNSNADADTSQREIILTREETDHYNKTGKLRGAQARYAAADRIVDADGKAIKAKDEATSTQKEEPAKERTPEDIAAAIDAAYARGEEAKAKGMTPKAMPAEFKAKGREKEAEAWTAGFEGRDLRQPGEEG